MVRDLVLLTVGWLLGLLAPAIVDSIRRRRESTAVTKALSAELHLLALRVIGACHFVHLRLGRTDRSYLEWMNATLCRLPGASTIQSVVDAVRMQLELSDDQIAHLAQWELSKPHGAISLRKQAVPLLDSRVSAIWEVAPQLQQQLLDIRAHLDLYNEDVEQARFYLQLSFQDLTEGNRNLMKQNLDQVYVNAANRARHIVDKILALPL